MTTIAVGNRRLLKLAGILDTVDAWHRKNKEPTYDQETLVHECGTPACALGHWAYMHPRKFSRTKLRAGSSQYHNGSGSGVEDAKTEFAITMDDYFELFGIDGCERARTAKEAAKYIRNFVKRRAA